MLLHGSKTSPHMAQRHLGIIVRTAYHYWRFLPVHVATSVSVEDMVADVVLSVTIASRKYKRKRAAESTFVTMIAQRRCHVLVSRHNDVKKRFATAMLPEDSLVNFSQPDYAILFSESRHGVERFLQFASDDLQQYMSNFLLTRRYHKIPEELLSEARKLVRQHGVTYSDFRAVFQCV